MNWYNQDTPEALFVTQQVRMPTWTSSHHPLEFSNYALFVHPTGFSGVNRGWPALHTIALQRLALIISNRN